MNFTLPVLTPDFYLSAAPTLLLCLSSLTLLMMAVSTDKDTNHEPVKYVNLGALLLALGFAFRTFLAPVSGGQVFLNGGYLVSTLGDFAQVLILIIAIVVSLLMGSSYLKQQFLRGEMMSLFHMTLVGMLAMVNCDDLITLFIGLEMASIGVYALIGYMHPSKVSQEAAVKYFILGGIAAAILLFGMAFLYATTGTFRISELALAIPKVSGNLWAQLGGTFLIAGIAFKMALVPFHMWTADAYEGAPTGLTAFMATAMKVMVVVAAIRVFDQGLSGLHNLWVPSIGFVAAASLLFANILALAQQSVKRLLAYSSIAHSGYMALAFAAMSSTGQSHQVPSVLFYLLAYTIVSLGTFAVIMWLENERCENIIIDDLAGLAKKHPKAALALAVFMLSLGGMPPTVGFISKLYVFNAALSQGLIALVLIACVGSTISLYYYLKIIVKMFMTDANPALGGLIQPKRSSVYIAVIAAAVILIIVAGTVAPEPMMELVRR